MNKALTFTITAMLLALGLAAAGCSAESDAESGTPTQDAPQAKQPVIQEPDLYRLFGSHLYVQNSQTGLNILDVSDPRRPRLVGRAAVTGGSGAEIYLYLQNQIIVMLKTATSACLPPKNLNPDGWSYGAEVAFVDTTLKTHPKVEARYCLPGQLVASRTVDNMLYIVTNDSTRGSRAISIDITDPNVATVVQQRSFPQASKEITVTAKAIFVVGKVSGQHQTSRVQYIQISKSGEMTPRGAIDLPGLPMGRFHQESYKDQFRVVTYDSSARHTALSIIDVTDPDKLTVMGSLKNFARGEKLYATRFDNDRAYVVTFQQTDPLWIISLADPTNPQVVGELQVPGWSDFLFPREKTLVAVGRGDNGLFLGLSLFDVSDLTNPQVLHQIQLGDSGSTSEANVDHRGVTILDLPGANSIVVVPYTRVKYDSSCVVTDMIQLVEITGSKLVTRGSVGQKGTIRRSLLVKSQLYSISDYEVLSVNVTNLSGPAIDTSVTVGTDPKVSGDYSSYCSYYENGGYYGYDMVEKSSPRFPFMCTLGEEAAGLTAPPATVLLGLLCLALRLRRRSFGR